MKKIFLAFVALACAMCGCSDDTVDTSAAETIGLSVESAPVGPDGAEVEIVVTSSAAWRIAGDCPWARPSAVAGNSGDKVVFTGDALEEFYSSCSHYDDEITTVDLSGCPSLKVIECERANLETLILPKALEGAEIELTTNAESVVYK